ncbi:hypothetical protein A3H38_04075 [candidate division WOR-1 bacterium RIFCSPLOWO2_02_FULL_46_20]|uniref:Uncharacterized protein n=1 Tax=candidate division WOR-1 bacterium RIFCSPLOWO2_02_FULL_46_20 TaxID=1802567 RepID=A0A1F4RHS8_UNCSA|nr:MAG: hypothetical protein A3J44_01540 [candidate division WOR-1 bacterium RIFCSPHIGHO2_02_FULL_45_12]OGC07666.1 MAG: hypothetical protein A3H38_04075 [candidate division WOR-1 bacterium RIFCSPLOWO2_02_FULL_46_20]
MIKKIIGPMIRKLGGAGQPSSINGRVARGRDAMRELQRDPEQQRQYEKLLDKINFRHGVPGPDKLLALPSAEALEAFLAKEIVDFFGPSEISFVGKTGKTPYAKLRDIATQNNRLIYVPGKGSTIYVSGQTGRDLLDIFEAPPQLIGVAPNVLSRANTQIVVVPISTTRELSPHGVIIITRATAPEFDPMVVLPILRIIGHDMAVVFARNKITI